MICDRCGHEESPGNLHRPLECIANLRADLAEAREWVRKMVHETQQLRCAFCGEAYPPGTPEANDDALAMHIRVCAKHPMRTVEADLAQSRKMELNAETRACAAEERTHALAQKLERLRGHLSDGS